MTLRLSPLWQFGLKAAKDLVRYEEKSGKVLDTVIM